MLNKWKWEFNAEVADNFDYIAKTSIQDYQRVIHLTVNIAKKIFNLDAKIIDIWSATWHTLKCLYNAGYKNIFWLESSLEMIKKSFNKATIIHSDTLPIYEIDFDYIIINWTLHFVKNRENYIKLLYTHLKKGWYCIITDKIKSSNLSTELYYDFKKGMWLSDTDILNKSILLDGVLITYPIEWYLDIFQKIWFLDIEIINVSPCFCTFLMKK